MREKLNRVAVVGYAHAQSWFGRRLKFTYSTSHTWIGSL